MILFHTICQGGMNMLTTTVVALGTLAAVAGIYKVLVSPSGSIKVFTFQFSWGK